MRGAQRVDLLIYGRGLLLLATHPSILALPLMAAVVDMLVSTTSGAVTDPLGGFGSGLFGILIQLFYLFAFGGAIIQASNIMRGNRGGFDSAWEETRRKAGGILMAALGFQFVTFFAGYAGSIFGGGIISLVLLIVAYFFLIMTIPAAAIGGLPGGLAISGSIRAVRANPLPCAILAIVFALIWVYLPQFILLHAAPYVNAIEIALLRAVVSAIILGYMAFPFASVYENTAFRGLW